VNTVLDENPSAFAAIPEPMFRTEALVTGVVLEVTVKKFAQHLGLDQGPNPFEERVVALHQIGDQQQVVLPGERNHLIRLFQVQRERLFTNHVFAGLQTGHGLRVMQERRRGDVNQIDVRLRHERLDRLNIGNAKPLGHREGRFAMRPRHGHQFYPGYLREVLQRVQAETACPNYPDANGLTACHNFSLSVPKTATRLKFGFQRKLRSRALVSARQSPPAGFDPVAFHVGRIVSP
jgi:hypothetical protein